MAQLLNVSLSVLFVLCRVGMLVAAWVLCVLYVCGEVSFSSRHWIPRCLIPTCPQDISHSACSLPCPRLIRSKDIRSIALVCVCVLYADPLKNPWVTIRNSYMPVKVVLYLFLFSLTPSFLLWNEYLWWTYKCKNHRALVFWMFWVLTLN